MANARIIDSRTLSGTCPSHDGQEGKPSTVLPHHICPKTQC